MHVSAKVRCERNMMWLVTMHCGTPKRCTADGTESKPQRFGFNLHSRPAMGGVASASGNLCICMKALDTHYKVSWNRRSRWRQIEGRLVTNYARRSESPPKQPNLQAPTPSGPSEYCTRPGMTTYGNTTEANPTKKDLEALSARRRYKRRQRAAFHANSHGRNCSLATRKLVGVVEACVACLYSCRTAATL